MTSRTRQGARIQLERNLAQISEEHRNPRVSLTRLNDAELQRNESTVATGLSANSNRSENTAEQSTESSIATNPSVIVAQDVSSANANRSEMEMQQPVETNLPDQQIEVEEDSSTSANQSQNTTGPSSSAQQTEAELAKSLNDSENALPQSLKPSDSVECYYTPSSKVNCMHLWCENDQQLYKTNSKRNAAGDKAFSCINKDCPCRVYEKDVNGIKTYYLGPGYKGHNHGTATDKKLANALKAKIKQRCENIDDVDAGSHIKSVAQIYNSVMAEHGSPVEGVSLKSMSRNLHKIRSKCLPPCPKDISQIVDAFQTEYVRNNYGLTIRNQAALQTMFFHRAFEGDDFAYCMFISQDIVKAIKQHIAVENRQYYLDGTFGVVPMGIFKQLLIIHINFMGQILPFIYILMDKRPQIAYTAVLEDIHTNVLPLNCRFAMTDYEVAIRNAYRTVVPDVTQHACHFHYAQALHRYVKKNCPGLMKLIFSSDPENKEAHKTYRKLIYLPLLPAQHINKTFQRIALEAMTRYPEKFNNFLLYIKRQWLTREGPEKISVFGIPHRTQGAVEAHNRVIGKEISKRSHFFRFVRGLLKMEKDKWTTVSALATSGGGSAPTQKKSSKDRDAQILDAENALGRGDIDELQFLDRIIYKNGPKDPQSYFTNLSEADDYFAEYEDEDSDDNSNGHIDTLLNVSIPKMPVDPNDARLCKVCYDRDSDCVLLPCRHFCCCLECYESWKETDPRLNQDAMTEDEMAAFLADAEASKPTCPICREKVIGYLAGVKFT